MPKITAIRTIRIAGRPNLVWTEIDIDDGLTGLGESFRAAGAVEAAIHELCAPRLPGADPNTIERFSRLFCKPVVGFNSSDPGIRAIAGKGIVPKLPRTCARGNGRRVSSLPPERDIVIIKPLRLGHPGGDRRRPPFVSAGPESAPPETQREHP